MVSPSTLQATQDDDRTSPFRLLVLLLGVLGVLSAAFVFTWSSINAASARFEGSTTNGNSLFSAAAVDLVVAPKSDGGSLALLVDADGLYPGLIVERCFNLTYYGTLEEVPVRMTGQRTGGTGLEEYLSTTIEVGTGQSSDCADFDAEGLAYQGSLGNLWRDHQRFDTGIDLIHSASNESTATVRFVVEVDSVDDAQGLTTEFWITLEARR